MSIKAYGQLVGKHELYASLQASEQDIDSGRTKPHQEVMNSLKEEISHE